MKKTFLAFDCGATSGRAILATFEDGAFKMEEVYRFPSGIIELGGKYYWDIMAIYSHFLECLGKLGREGITIDSIGIDTWGVDFGFVADDGALLGNPRAYRDPYTTGIPEEVFGIIPRSELYAATGIQILPFNSVFQLPEIVQPGSGVGLLREEIASSCGLPQIPVVAVAGHDTASAIAAVPAADEKFAYLSSGTWSLMGIEVPSPIINEESARLNFTNEGGIEGTTRFLKNITGMWLLEQCRKAWKAAGREYSYAELVKMAEAEAAFPGRINPDDPRFANPADMAAEIQASVGTNPADMAAEIQASVGKPLSDSEIVSCIYHSLADRYKEVLGMLQDFAPFRIEKLHIIGGGSANGLLNQWTADAIGLPVVAGPTEATAIGNLMVQAKAAGLVADRWEMRRMIASAFSVKTFTPNN